VQKLYALISSDSQPELFPERESIMEHTFDDPTDRESEELSVKDILSVMLPRYGIDEYGDYEDSDDEDEYEYERPW
jgi:hypothetical protein